MKISFLPFCLLLLTISCSRQATSISGKAPCLSDKIKVFQTIEAACPDRFVAEYTFQGKTVYVLNHGTCGADMTDEVIDANCKHLGYLGGFVGNTRINGEPFSNATGGKVVWKMP